MDADGKELVEEEDFGCTTNVAGPKETSSLPTCTDWSLRSFCRDCWLSSVEPKTNAGVILEESVDPVEAENVADEIPGACGCADAEEEEGEAEKEEKLPKVNEVVFSFAR